MVLSGTNVLMGLPQGSFDGHAHVFSTDLPMTPIRRYTPDQAAPFEAYCRLLRTHSLDGALLVQPSFLGIDNRYLLRSLTDARDIPDLQFRGVAMTDLDTSASELAHLADAGVVGMRLNQLDRTMPNLRSQEWRAHLRDLADLGWHLEIQIEGARLPDVLPLLLDHTPCLVVDHFGLPEDGDWRHCPGFHALLNAPRDRVMVKLSAPYRAFRVDVNTKLTQAAASAARALMAHFGPTRLIWGSDWPWTRHESGRSFEEALAWRTQWEALGGNDTTHGKG